MEILPLALVRPRLYPPASQMEGAVPRAFFDVNPAAGGWPLMVGMGDDRTLNEVARDASCRRAFSA
ncbi:MAG: hypothetical protein DMD92_19595 [Candidatus Rokuibacteriota bacterium]|nr:MAG: hypothetical protein DMD92_19595 [Candidatus Rokubacteria bacterium]